MQAQSEPGCADEECFENPERLARIAVVEIKVVFVAASEAAVGLGSGRLNLVVVTFALLEVCVAVVVVGLVAGSGLEQRQLQDWDETVGA